MLCTDIKYILTVLIIHIPHAIVAYFVLGCLSVALLSLFLFGPVKTVTLVIQRI